MPNPSILPRDMTLYSAAEPEGRKFLKGDQWPGDAWSEKPGGEPAGSKTAKAALEDMSALQGQVVGLQDTIQGLTHDLAQAAKDRDEATGKVDAAEQRAADAERAKEEAEAAARQATEERDRLAAVETELRGKIAALEADVEKVPGLVEALNTANQVCADQNAEIEALKAEIAKVDGDGDGKVGGRPKKAPAQPAPEEDGAL